MYPSAHADTFARDHLPPPDQWPEFLDSPDTRYPQRLNATVELLDRWVANGHGDAIALRAPGGVRWTYAQLLARVDAIAHVLRTDLGLVPGNRVLLRGSNHPMMAACLLAVLKAGLVAVPTMPLLRARDLAPVVDKAQVTAALCDRALQDELERLNEQTGALKQILYFNDDSGADDALETHLAGAPATFTACDTAQDDVALIAFTSGTTGTPKGTMHFHRDIIAM